MHSRQVQAIATEMATIHDGNGNKAIILRGSSLFMLIFPYVLAKKGGGGGERRGRSNDYISPHCAITTSRFGMSLPRYPVLVFSILRTISMPSMTFPNTTCFPSRKGVGTVVMKNWEPLVSGPAFCVPSLLVQPPEQLRRKKGGGGGFFLEKHTAIESNPGLSCLSVKFSSANALVP